jgi:hypothetical protein
VSKAPPSPHKRPRPLDWNQKAKAWGIDPADLNTEPEPVDGPLVDGCDRFHSQLACPGSFRITSQEDAVWEATCDHCRAVTGIPARAMDPQIRRDAKLKAAGLPDLFAGRKLQRTPDNAPVLDGLRNWVDSYAKSGKHADRLGSLLPAPCLYGQPGRGKTHCLVAICERVIAELDLSVAFTTTRSLLHDLQRFDADVIRGRAWERAVTVDVLALDDLGSEQSTDWRLDQLAHLIDARYQAERPVVVATNYPPAAWEQVLDARTISRLSAMTWPIELTGDDRRQPNDSIDPSQRSSL